jgi:ADP-heptose:LPS heptosyltransferase
MVRLSEFTVLQNGHSVTVEPGLLRHLLKARTPTIYFSTLIGDSVLTLPTVRALAEMFTAPLTLLCPKVAFDLCFREVSSRLVDITGSPPVGPTLGPPSNRILDYDTLASEIGPVDVFIDAVPWDVLSNVFVRPLRQRLAPTTSIGFPTGDAYDVVIPRDVPHAADLTFKLARLFDPSAQIETYAQQVPIPPAAQEKIRAIRASLPAGAKVLAVHADTSWIKKQWPVTRFVDLLDRFLLRHSDFVVWIVGMGYEELNVGRERGRVFSYLGVPLDVAMGMVASADLFVGIDSCMLHAADLAGVPGAGLFGPTQPATWGFRFAPHRHIYTSTMADITVDEVLGALEDLADEHAGTPSRLRDGMPSGASGDLPDADLLSAVRQFYDIAQSWHREQPATRSDGGDIAAQALHLHATNFRLWHHEDAVRRPGVSDSEVARRKRSIDDLNAERNAAIEDIDVTLLDCLNPNEGAPLYTETPGTIVDRLSVLALRLLHTNRAEDPSSHLSVLEDQHDDLIRGLEQLLRRIRDGEISFKLYRQFKSARQRSYCALFEENPPHQ